MSIKLTAYPPATEEETIKTTLKMGAEESKINSQTIQMKYSKELKLRKVAEIKQMTLILGKLERIFPEFHII